MSSTSSSTDDDTAWEPQSEERRLLITGSNNHTDRQEPPSKPQARYDTFERIHPSVQKRQWWQTSPFGPKNPCPDQPKRRGISCWVLLVSFAVITTATYLLMREKNARMNSVHTEQEISLHDDDDDDDETFNTTAPTPPTHDVRPVWMWDHNFYNPTHVEHPKNMMDETDLAAQARNLLLVQITSADSLDLSDISSRPNRAYARQWGRNYVRYVDDTSSACDALEVMTQIMNNRQADGGLLYDVMALLPPDAIIVDLDYDLLRLVPEDKLASIATSDSRETGIIFFNLHHSLARRVVKVLKSATRCTDVHSVFQQAVAVISQQHMMASIVELPMSSDGYVPKRTGDHDVSPSSGPYCIKRTPFGHWEDAAAERVALQTTADSVCYRYYPRCEVL